MGARADKIEIVDRVVPIVRPEPRALRERGQQAEGAAVMRGQIGRKIARRIVEAGDDPSREIGQQPFFELGDDLARERLAFAVQSIAAWPRWGAGTSA